MDINMRNALLFIRDFGDTVDGAGTIENVITLYESDQNTIKILKEQTEVLKLHVKLLKGGLK